MVKAGSHFGSGMQVLFAELQVIIRKLYLLPNKNRYRHLCRTS